MGNKDFADIIRLRLGHTGLGWESKFDHRCPYVERDLKTQRKYKGKVHVRTEAETGVVLAQAKECQGLPANTRI